MLWRQRPGANLIEVLVAAVLAGVVLMAIGGFVVGMAQKSRQEADRDFAQRKALQILEELNTEQRRAQNIEGLTRFADQGPRFELTLAKVGPEDAISGNPSSDGAYRFIRTVSLDRVPGSEDAFQATVKVWRNTPRYTSPGIPPEKPVAVVSTILRNQLGHTQPVQVLKLYVLSIENVPHLFFKNPQAASDMLFPNAKDMRTKFEEAVAAIEAANPWLRLEYRYITRMGLGRDPYYRPYVNNDKGAVGAGRDPFKFLFNYPAKTTTGVPDFFSESTMYGRLRLGTAGTSDLGIAQNRSGYSIADEFNHPVRYPLEHVNPTGQAAQSDPVGITLGSKDSNLSLVQFLDDMIANPEKYRNAIVVNLHGAAFPAPALRNYADAAKDLYDTNLEDEYDPFDSAEADDVDSYPLRARRIVTHPLHLVTPSSQPVRLLVHAYLDNGMNMPRSGLVGESPLWSESNRSRTARIVIPGLRPYLAQQNNPTSLGDIANDLRITVMQREDTGGGEKYTAWKAWPIATDTWSHTKIASSTEQEANTTGMRRLHCGPHANAHPNGGRHHASAGPMPIAQHGRDPRWIGPGGNDLEILLTDVEYDARNVADTGMGSPTYGSLAGAMHRLQYFPDPYLPFINRVDSTELSITEARNTARVIVEFRLTNAGANKRFEVQTQLALNSGVAGVDSEGFHTNLNDPSVSRTWFYGSAANVPWTDRVQLVGDPRHNPYADLRQANMEDSDQSAASLALNRYWTDFQKGQTIYGGIKNSNGLGLGDRLTDFNPFLPPSQYSSEIVSVASIDRFLTHIKGSADSWNGMKFNGPAYFDIWRRALTSANALFLNPFDEPMKFVLLGGEFNLADQINSSAVMAMSAGPFAGGTSDAGEIADGLMEGVRPGWAARLETDHGTWYAKPWLGELVDLSNGHHSTNYASQWVTRGNLVAEQSNGHMDLRRVRLSSVPGFDPLSDKTDANDTRRPGEAAFKALLNAHGSGGSQWDQDLGADFVDATRTSVGDTLFTALNLPTMPTTTRARGGFELSGGGSLSTSGNISPGNIAWMAAGVTSGVYSTNGMSPNQSIAAIALRSDTPAAEDTSASRAGFVVSMVGGDVGASKTAEVLTLALGTAVDAYHTGTRFAFGPGNTDPLPRIRMYKPLKDATVGGGGVVPLEWYSKWIRADGTPYSPHFTNTFVKPFNQALGHPNDVVYFVKYRPSAGAIFLAADVGSGGDNITPFLEGAHEPPLGITPIEDATTLGTPVKATWRLGGIANGDYIIRVEAYGRGAFGQAMGANYAYQDLPVKVKR